VTHGARIARLVTTGAVIAVLSGALSAVPASAAQRPPGGGRPTPGSGIGTKAALSNPQCVLNERTKPYGRLDWTSVGDGPVCVKPWDDGDDNGGATYQGVTADRVTVVVILPNETQRGALSRSSRTAPVNRASNADGTLEDSVHDYLLPLMRWYETWGRDIEIRFVTSTGDDESAQRADAVTVKAEKPFAVIDLVTSGLDVFDTTIAQAKILVWGSATTTEKALAQAPYRWGLSDTEAVAVNAAEVLGKQLVGKKAEFGGDAVKSQTRKFGAVYIPNLVDIDRFKSELKKYGGTLASSNDYRSSGVYLGEPVLAQEQAPIVVTRMKDAGVTTVILFSDLAMNQQMMSQATKQNWFPEWFVTGALFQDLGLFARTYDQDQFRHAFGISNLFPYVVPDPTPPPPGKSLDTLTDELNWYWGEGIGTETSSLVPNRLEWLMNGIHAAGPELTPKTFQQGLFSIPARGGAASGETTSFFTGFGRTPGLPYDEYLLLTLDFSPVWWDPDTIAPGTGTGSEAKGAMWYLGGAKRYVAGTWPKKQFGWFETDGAVTDFDARQPPIPEYAGDCTTCPSHGAPGQPGSPSQAGFVAKANGSGAVAL